MEGVHNGAGNSAPPHGGATTHEAALVIHLNPIWFDHELGWNGGSHEGENVIGSLTMSLAGTMNNQTILQTQNYFVARRVSTLQ